MGSPTVKLYDMRISTMSKDELAPLLKQLRKDAGVSEAQMAVWQDVNVKTIQNWERGFTKPRLGDVLIYETRCGKTVLDLRDQDSPTSECNVQFIGRPTHVERRRTRRTSRRRALILMDSSNQAGPFDLSRKAA